MLIPRDTKSHGTIFGGVILSYIDIAAGNEAGKHTSKRVVTKAMHEVVFVVPMFVRDIFGFDTELVRIGRTSIAIKVIVDAERVANPSPRVLVTEAEVVYVALDKSGRPTPVNE